MTIRERSNGGRGEKFLKALDQVPAGWNVGRLGNSVVSRRSGIWGDEARKDGNDIRCIRVADFDRASQRVQDKDVTFRSLSPDERRSRLLKHGDLLLEMSGGGVQSPVGFVVLYDRNDAAVCSNFVARIRLRQGMDPRFWTYVHGSYYGLRLTQRSIKQSTGIQNLDAQSYFREPALFPPADEQSSIADFLDRETGEIDAFIRDQEELIGLLQERRAATISHAVTKGLDSEVHLHPSGTPWWGKVPHHWRFSPVKHAARLLTGFPFASNDFVHSLDSISLLRGINVGIGSIDWAERVGWSVESRALYGEYELQTGDLVLGLDRPIISRGVRLARVAEHDLPALLLQRVALVRASSAAINDYLEFALQGSEFRSYIEPLFTGVSVPHLSVDQLGAFPIPLPPVAEQAAISKYLRHELELLDESISDAVAAVALSRERRSALISAAVTGKIDVRERGGCEG
jgi:type I restriction enzyme S subunit